MLGGCGGGGGASTTVKTGEGDAADRRLEAARQVSAADFPSAQGRTLQDIADRAKVVQAGLATTVYTPGENRVAFGVIDTDNSFVYGKSAVYVAPTPSDPAQGPFPAPADPLVVDSAFRSRGAAEEGGSLAAIYEANVPLSKPGRYAVLLVTKLPSGLVGAAAEIDVMRTSPIPAVGDRPPRGVSTETLAGAGGDIEAIETRDPPDEMHEADFAEVIGRKPVVLLFSTPALCESRVCGPVTDIAAQLQSKYGEQATFIHQEVFVENNPERGLRAPLRAFGLETEPWLFTFDSQGRVAARLEGSFGTDSFERAVKAALGG